MSQCAHQGAQIDIPPCVTPVPNTGPPHVPQKLGRKGLDKFSIVQQESGSSLKRSNSEALYNIYIKI